MRNIAKVAVVGGGLTILLAGTALAFDGYRGGPPCGYGYYHGMGPGMMGQGMMGPGMMQQGMMQPGWGRGWHRGWHHGWNRGPGKGMRRGSGLVRNFDALDTDKDGAVSREEFLAGTPGAKRFAALDADKNGVVTKDEIDAVVAKRVAAMRDRILQRFDIDGDGTVTKQEFDNPRAKRFALFDRNDDGKVEKKELQGMMRGPWGGRGMRGHGMMYGPGWGRGMGPGMMGQWGPGMGPGMMGQWGWNGPDMSAPDQATETPAPEAEAPKAE